MNKIRIYILSILHFLVDGLCAFTIVNKLYLNENEIVVFLVFLIYNLIAFCFQILVGIIIDKTRNHQMFLNISLIILILASTISLPPLFITILLGISNSFFHVIGGVYVQKHSIDKMKYLGIFVAFGAIGLSIGTNISSEIVLLLMLILTFVLGMLTNIFKDNLTKQNELGQISTHTIKYLLIILLVVLIRAMMGSACTPNIELGIIEVIALSFGIFLGKLLGGIFSDYCGIKITTIVSLSLALVGYIFFRNNYLIFLFSTILFNTTMPITLYFSNKLLKNHYGLSFGLLACMLFPGYILGYLYKAFGLSISPLIIISIVISLVAILYINEVLKDD